MAHPDAVGTLLVRPPAREHQVYRFRAPERSVLYTVVRGHLIDVLVCPRCGGRMRLIATIEDPRVIRRILAHLGLLTAGPAPGPSRPPPGRTGALVADIPA